MFHDCFVVGGRFSDGWRSASIRLAIHASCSLISSVMPPMRIICDKYGRSIDVAMLMRIVATSSARRPVNGMFVPIYPAESRSAVAVMID